MHLYLYYTLSRNRLERSKQDTKLRTEHANQLKLLETATNEKKMEVKKKLHDVRKSLRAHLVNTRDPQVGTIMRLVDESLIYHFMEKYSGFSMTAQAILSLIGSSMNTNLMNPSICDEDKPMNLLQAESDGGDSPVRKNTKDVPILRWHLLVVLLLLLLVVGVWVLLLLLLEVPLQLLLVVVEGVVGAYWTVPPQWPASLGPPGSGAVSPTPQTSNPLTSACIAHVIVGVLRRRTIQL